MVFSWVWGSSLHGIVMLYFLPGLLYSVSCFSLGGIASFLFFFFDIVFGTKFDSVVSFACF